MTIPGYSIRQGSTLERSQLVKFIQRTYQELFPEQKDFAHLATTVEQYFSKDTPLWWVDFLGEEVTTDGEVKQGINNSPSSPVACLWMGNAIDQIKGDRHAHIFLLYVAPEHRRRGIARTLMQYAENWAKQRGDQQIGLQVFQSNPVALTLYNQLGYQTQSLWMIKPISH
ncbi:GCN5-related N-acetyltransferase [Nostoc sp. NIES-3756]|uniref:GNAT family N-acetyltransferase n=1 Tax=Nostoc sp. NIES-3756 TaxID=1751286 RepID=UPI000720BB5F|nr:GNAT family N-acetyltransferase [Nostoc sp. NIES-3756]BAT51218.1 GCN5-related N-acetyltransferase [Nostoc sp. NIES-3756]